MPRISQVLVHSLAEFPNSWINSCEGGHSNQADFHLAAAARSARTRAYGSNPPGGNRCISVSQSQDHVRLLRPGYQPKDAPGTVEHRIGQCHAPPAHVHASQRDILVLDLQVPGPRGLTMRCDHPIPSPGAQDRAPAANRRSARVSGRSGGSGLQVDLLDRHGMDLLGGQRGVWKQAFAQVREVPVRVSGGATRSSTWATWTLFQGTSWAANARSICHGVWPPLTAIMKRPRAATASRASSRDDFGRLHGNRIRIVEHLNSHRISQLHRIAPRALPSRGIRNSGVGTGNHEVRRSRDRSLPTVFILRP